MVCPYCKTKNEDEARSCRVCGGILIKSGVETKRTRGNYFKDAGQSQNTSGDNSFVAFIGQSGLKGYLVFFAVTFGLSIAGIIVFVAKGLVSIF